MEELAIVLGIGLSAMFVTAWSIASTLKIISRQLDRLIDASKVMTDGVDIRLEQINESLFELVEKLDTLVEHEGEQS